VRYSDPQISAALHETTQAILTADSPPQVYKLILGLWKEWQAKQKKHKTKKSTKTLHVLNANLEFRKLFGHRILPGDESLIDECMEDLPQRGMPFHSISVYQIPLTIYLEIVVIRVYLHASPEMDERIYHLCRVYELDEVDALMNSPFIDDVQGKVVCPQTLPEKVFDVMLRKCEDGTLASEIPTHPCRDTDIVDFLMPPDIPLAYCVLTGKQEPVRLLSMPPVPPSTPPSQQISNTGPQVLAPAPSNYPIEVMPAQKPSVLGTRQSARLRNLLSVYDAVEMKRLKKLKERRTVRWKDSPAKGWLSSESASEYDGKSEPTSSGSADD
jgi:hypothetical protein